MSALPAARRKIKFYLLRGYNRPQELSIDYLRGFLVGLRRNKQSQGRLGDLVLEYEPGINLYLSDVSVRGGVVYGEIGFLRLKDIPKGFDMNKYVSIDLPLGQNQGIFDLTHFAIFDNGVVAYEYFMPAPRPGGLRHYLRNYLVESLCGQDEECAKRVIVVLKPLTYISVRDQLNDVAIIKKLELRVRYTVPTDVRVAKSSLVRSIIDSLPFLRGLGREISLTLSSGRSREGIKLEASDVIELYELIMDYLEKLKVTAIMKDGSKREIDFFNMHLETEKEIEYEIVRGDGERNLRTTSRESAYKALREAYNELKDDIDEILQNSEKR